MSIYLAGLFAISVLFSAAASAQTIEGSKSIDLDLVRTVDVTGDGKPDTITLNLKADTFKSPFTWTLTISSSGKQIWKSESNDANIDSLFHDEGYELKCKDYTSCKKKYYYHDILDSLVLTENDYSLEGILDREAPNTLYPVGRKFLIHCCAIPPDRSDQILAKIEQQLVDRKAVVIAFLTSPVKSGPPMVFAPEVGRFVPIYEE